VLEGGIGIEHALGGSVRIGRRDTLDGKLGLRLMRAVEIEGEASVFKSESMCSRATDSLAFM